MTKVVDKMMFYIVFYYYIEENLDEILEIYNQSDAKAEEL